jgi:hypothetical protein
MKHFSSLSRRLKEDWDGQVFQHDVGEIEPIEPIGSREKLHLVLPPLPKIRRVAASDLKASNARQIKDMPWTLGLIEAIGAVDVVRRQKLQTKNRIALILLDSNFEIALKEFLVHRTDLFPRKTYNDTKIRELFSKRDIVIKEVAARVKIPQTLLDKADHYYGLRNKFIHERATADVSNADVENYRSVVEEILTILFDLNF